MKSLKSGNRSSEKNFAKDRVLPTQCVPTVYTSAALLFFAVVSFFVFCRCIALCRRNVCPSSSRVGNLYANAVPSFEFLTMLLFCAIIKILWSAHPFTRTCTSARAHIKHTHARSVQSSRATKLHCKPDDKAYSRARCTFRMLMANSPVRCNFGLHGISPLGSGCAL